MSQNQTAHTQTAHRFEQHADRFARIVEAAAPHWDAPTPCEGWAVQDVVTHVIDTERQFLAQRRLDLPPTNEATDPATTWREHAAAVVEVLGRDGVAETAYDGYFGPSTVADTMSDF